MAIIVLLLLLFLMYSVIQASSASADSDGEEGGGDGGDGGREGYSGGGRRRKTTTTTTTETTTEAQATPPPHVRPYSFVFCTVGPSVEAANKVLSVPICDFIVYTDVVVYDSKIGAYDDPISYDVFLEMAKKYQQLLAWQGYPYPDEEEKLRQFGISFSAHDLNYLELSLRSVSPGDLWRTYGILTAGVASYSRGSVASDSANVNKLKSIMSSIDKMLQTARSGNTTVLKTIFLGVKLAGTTTSSQYDAAAMNELKSIGKVDVLILISHLLRPELGDKCVIQPLVRYNGEAMDVAAPPAMERLIPLVDKSMPFRVALSFTMSVFLFEPKGGLTAKTGFGDKCDLYYQLDFSEVCHVKQQVIKLSHNLSSSATAPKDKVFMVFEDVNSTYAKMDEAIKEARKKDVPLVWAVYDVQNDAANCKGGAKPKQPSYERFSVVRELLEKDYKEHPDKTTKPKRRRH